MTNYVSYVYDLRDFVDHGNEDWANGDYTYKKKTGK